MQKQFVYLVDTSNDTMIHSMIWYIKTEPTYDSKKKKRNVNLKNKFTY
jgi:hypothetical protein